MTSIHLVNTRVKACYPKLNTWEALPSHVLQFSVKQLHCHFIMSHLRFCLLHLEIYIYGCCFFQTESGLRLRHCRPFSAVRAHLVYFHSSLESILAPNSWTRNQSCLTSTYYSVTNVHSCQLHTVNTVSFFFSLSFFKRWAVAGQKPIKRPTVVSFCLWLV